MNNKAISELIIDLRNSKEAYAAKRKNFDALPAPTWDAVPQSYKSYEWELRYLADRIDSLERDLVAAIGKRFENLSDRDVIAWWEQ